MFELYGQHFEQHLDRFSSTLPDIAKKYLKLEKEKPRVPITKVIGKTPFRSHFELQDEPTPTQ